MAKRLIQVESLRSCKQLTASFKPGPLAPSAAILLIDHDLNKICMVTKRKKIDWGGQTVFPGGLTDHADSKLVNYIQKYCSAYIKKYNFLFDDLMYRVNAMRELFEETGILLFRNKHELNDNNLIYPTKPKMLSFHDNNEIMSEWRTKIMDDPFQFEELHRSMNIVPDILSLVPWVRLQTPWLNGRRWDTRFYLCCIDTLDIDERVIHPLGHEIETIDWIPINILPQKKLRFPPPTVMKMRELDIICNKENMLLDEYKHAFYTRNVKVIRPKLAVCVETKQRMIVFSRDYLYDVLDLDEVECNDEYEEKQQNIHRIYIKGKGNMEVVCSYNRLYEYKSHTIASNL